MLDGTVWCVCALLEDNCCLTITDTRQEMAACFSHEAGRTTVVCALQQLKMWKVFTLWVPRQLTEEHWKNLVGLALNFLTQYEEDGNDLLERIIIGDESWINFYEPKRKSTSMAWKKRERSFKKKFKNK